MTTLWTVLIVLGVTGASAVLGALGVGWFLTRIEPGTQTPGVLRGGLWIGVLERVIITGAVMLGSPEAVVAVVAIKGLGRYPELRDTTAAERPQIAERFIIGTLASYVFAGLLGAAGLIAIGAVS